MLRSLRTRLTRHLARSQQPSNMTKLQQKVYQRLQDHHKEAQGIYELLSREEAASSQEIQTGQKRLSRLGAVLEVRDQMHQCVVQMADLEDTLNKETDKEMLEFCQEELQQQSQALEGYQEQALEEIISLVDNQVGDGVEFDTDIALLEFRPGVGGTEGAIFAYELMQMYSSYCLSQSLRMQVLKEVSEEGTQAPAIKSAKCKVTGPDAYNKLICESGVHKVIRVPETEAKGRLHSSTAQMIVTPEIPLEFELNEKELEYQYMRASGAGGQHVNTTDSACRITHTPTQIQVTCQEDRNQHRNRDTAREMMKEKLFQIQLEKHMAKMAQYREDQAQSGDRSDKIRTYNFPQDRITDHRLGITLYGIKSMMAGEYVEEFVEAFLNKTRNQRIKEIVAQLTQE